MIREMERRDLEAVAALWLAANLQAHAFIPASYWRENLPAVREQLAAAEVYVWEGSGEILGLLGLQGGAVAGLFVRDAARGRGIGKALLDCAKDRREALTLQVYARNPRALAFYRREGFRCRSRDVDPATGEVEYGLVWRRRDGEDGASEKNQIF